MLGIVGNERDQRRKTWIFDGIGWANGPILEDGPGCEVARMHNTGRLVSLRYKTLGGTYIRIAGPTGFGPEVYLGVTGTMWQIDEEPDGGIYCCDIMKAWDNSGKVLYHGNRRIRLGGFVVRSMPREPRQTYFLSDSDMFIDEQHSVLNIRTRDDNESHRRDYNAATLQGGMVYLSSGLSIYTRDPRIECIFPLYESNDSYTLRTTLFTEGLRVCTLSDSRSTYLHLTDIRSPCTEYTLDLTDAGMDKPYPPAIFCT